MNKKSIVLVTLGAVALGVAGGAALTGRVVASRLSEQTAVLNRLFPNLRVDEQVERGVFHTTRTVKLSLGCLPTPSLGGSMTASTPLEVTWRDEIQHGPLPGGTNFGVALIDSAVLVPELIAKQVQTVLGDRAPLSAHTLVGFLGGFESEVTLPSVSFRPTATEQVQFSGAKLHISGRAPLSSGTLSYRSVLAPLSLRAKARDAHLSLELGEMELSGKLDYDPKSSHVLVPFEVDGTLAGITLSTRMPSFGGPPRKDLHVELSKLKGTSRATLARDLWSARSGVSASLTLNGASIEQVELTSVLRRVHVPSYQKLLAKVMALGTSCEKPLGTLDPSTAFADMKHDAFALLGYAPEYSMEPIAIQLDGKRAELHYSLSIDGITPADESKPLSDVIEYKSVAHARAKVEVAFVDAAAKLASRLLGMPVGAAGQAQAGSTTDPGALVAQAMIDNLISHGYVLRDGDFVRASIDTLGGKVTLNGKSFEMPTYAN